jgi:hypothetical protein
MTKKISFFVVTVAAVALVLSGCSRGPGMDDMEPDDMATVLPHIGTWYFADPDPDDDKPVAPNARLELTDTTFAVKMGDDDMTTFELFQTPGFTKFEVEGTYTAGADGTFSFSLPDEDMDGVPDLTAFVVEPVQLAPALVVGLETAQLGATADAMVVIDPATPNMVTISGAFMPALLNLPGVMEVTACKGAPCMMAP